jgi:damage-control phosphatase, subfamily I
MKIHIECLPCILKQILEAAKMSTSDEKQTERIMDLTLVMMQNYRDYCCTPDLVEQIHTIVKEETGNADPYADIKERDIKAALRLYPELKEIWTRAEDKITSALKISATGNIIDSAIYSDMDIEACVEKELNRPFALNDSEIFKDKLRNAKTLLIIGDNSGETVFDRILAESLSLDIMYAVRSGPVINDATIEQAIASGLDGSTRIIRSGCTAPGTILDRCSKEFKEIFYGADLVISKGQGNYESLSECDRDIFFLLKAKCDIVASALGVEVGEYVFEYKGKDEVFE